MNSNRLLGGTLTNCADISDTQSATAEILNVAPVVGPISGPVDPVELGIESVCVSAEFEDPGTVDTHTAQWNWGDGNIQPGTVYPGGPGYGTVDDCHVYTEPGTYVIELSVTDDDGAVGESTFQVVVYDPDAGFVTGGGSIDSLEGAYAPDPHVVGEASFDFVWKYKKGTLTGNTQFQLNEADLYFSSTRCDWLAITESNYAEFKGTGTINDASDYKFQIWAGDDDPDTFRIRIWYEDGSEVVVYDNGFDQALSGGNVKIHAK